MDALKNFAYSLVATPPSPATSGTSLVVTAGQGALFPAAPFDATIWPSGVQPLSTNAEIVRVTAVATDTLTITRAQYGTTAQSITAGYQIAQTIDAHLLGQLAPLSGATFTGEVAGPDFNASGLTGATAGSRFVGATSSGAPTSGTFVKGDFIVDQYGKMWVCTASGTPGSWQSVGNGTVGTTGAVTATGSTQYSSAALPNNYNIVSGATATTNGGAGTAVILPFISYAGQCIWIDNTDSTHWLKIYPSTGQSIDSAGANNPVWIAPSAYWLGIVETTGASGNWASAVPSLNSDSNGNITVTYANGQTTFGLSSTTGTGGVVLDSNALMSSPTITAPIINTNSVGNTTLYSGSGTNTLYLPVASSDTLVSLAATQTLTNKTISGSSNTISNVSLTSGVTGTLPVGNGGTGLTSPGTSGNILTSNGSAWTSSSPAAAPGATVPTAATVWNGASYTNIGSVNSAFISSNFNSTASARTLAYMTLSVGTWLLTAQISANQTSNTSDTLSGYLSVTAGTLVSAGSYFGTGSGQDETITLSFSTAYTVASGTSTVTLGAQTLTANGNILAAVNGLANATGMTAVRIA